MNCPVCNSVEIDGKFPFYSGTCVTSDMMVLEDANINNGICRDCGLIFNGAGTRGFTDSFYRNSYSLMLRSKNATIQNFTGGAQMSQAQLTNKILHEMVDLNKKGRVLEAGAGKGEFLQYFIEDKPEWEKYAFEPSASFDVLANVLPEGHAQRCDYPDYKVEAGSVDLVVALGVLEHVENPFDMMQWAAKALKQGGYFYVRVPNFENNPNDLFCVDHLSKLTQSTLCSLAEAAGFEVISVKEGGVPIFMMLKKTGLEQTIANSFSDNLNILEKNIKIADASMNAVLKGQKCALDTGTNFAIFGAGASGLFGPFFGKFALETITAYIDENQSMWGSTIHGRPVVGLDGIDKLNIQHVALAISPVYYEIVKEKLKAFDITLYSGG